MPTTRAAAAVAVALWVLLSCLPCLPPARAQIERGFNETCDFDDQCVDFRLKCSEGRCACVKYFHWDEYSRQCVTFKDLKYMLSDMEEKHHTHGRLMSETNKVFMGMMWTGLAVLLIGLVLASGCLFYGCCWDRSCCCPQDKLSKSRLPSGLQRQPNQRTAEATVPGSSNTQDRLQRGAQGTGVDYIPALYETTSFV
ncbi:uncharacterized protein LOC117641704 isoform X2 [Thrips palmi]|uniref:Uncharacterized protein LOC117641704 isoform X2 n=1 Tax=Thrips palmi TaxID=161013 RepID=A0A6P8Y738_THRPL|nr:uncharacterized protein LOC117641704 isoform X2 [Thrips palmi]